MVSHINPNKKKQQNAKKTRQGSNGFGGVARTNAALRGADRVGALARNFDTNKYG
jgi:hypothetical protein